MFFVVLWLFIGTRLQLQNFSERQGVFCGALVVYRHSLTPAELHSTAEPVVPLSLSQLNDLNDPVFDGVGLAGFKSRANAFLLA